LLEPCAVKAARTVLRGEGRGNPLLLPGGGSSIGITVRILFQANDSSAESGDPGRGRQLLCGAGRRPEFGRTTMTVEEIVELLTPLGTETYKKVLSNHGVQEPAFGVKIEDLKRFQKRIQKDYQLALALYDTGIYDAMYLAGLIADDARMTKKDLRRWLDKANCHMLSEYTVPWVAAGSNHGSELALEWIESPKEGVVAAGWATLRSLVAIKDDADLYLA
jgi:hypothetical protein